jgi:hypothetical protein
LSYILLLFSSVFISSLFLSVDTQLWRGLTGYHLNPNTALQRCAEYFRPQSMLKKPRKVNNLPHHQVPTNRQHNVLICLVDELDFLLTRDYRVIYNLFDWSLTVSQSNFLLIGISNTTDLPERISSRVQSRANINFNRLTFQVYDHIQIQQILKNRLLNLKLPFIDDKIIEWISRKASSVVPDLRGALHISQTSLELIRDAIKVDAIKKDFDVIQLVNAAASRYRSSPFIAVTSNLPNLHKGILIIFCKHRRAVCGGDGHASLAGLTSIMSWEKFNDFIGKVNTDFFFRKEQQASSSSTSVATSAAVAASSSSSNEKEKKNLHFINLTIPPIFLFNEALDCLASQNILSTTNSYLSYGKPITIYFMNPSLMEQDVATALVDSPWLKYLNS